MASELRLKTQQAIDEIRDAHDGCELVMLIDVDTGLVLCKSSDTVISQNRLDELASSAQTERKSSLTSAMIDTSENADLLSSIRVDKDSVTAVVSPINQGDDTLVCQFNSMPDRSVLNSSARALFDLTGEVEAA